MEDKCATIPIPYCNVVWEEFCKNKPKCETVRERQCKSHPRKICTTYQDRRCTISNERVCRTEYSKVCTATTEKVCRQVPVPLAQPLPLIVYEPVQPVRKGKSLKDKLLEKVGLVKGKV